MKKTITMLLVLVLTLSMVACGTNSGRSTRSRARPRDDSSVPPSSSTVDDREGITIIVPAYVFAVFEYFDVPSEIGGGAAEFAQRYVDRMREEEGVISATLNADNSATLVGTEEFFQERIDIYVGDVDYLVSDYTSEISTFSITNITFSDSYNECEMTLTASEYEASHISLVSIFASSFLWVQVYRGMSDPSITFTFIDSDTGNLLGVLSYPEVV